MELANETRVSDRHGSPVTLGSRVRLLDLPHEALNAVPDGERVLFKDVVGRTFTVDRIDERGQLWVAIGGSIGAAARVRYFIPVAPESVKVELP